MSDNGRSRRPAVPAGPAGAGRPVVRLPYSAAVDIDAEKKSTRDSRLDIHVAASELSAKIVAIPPPSLFFAAWVREHGSRTPTGGPEYGSRPQADRPATGRPALERPLLLSLLGSCDACDAGC